MMKLRGLKEVLSVVGVWFGARVGFEVVSVRVMI